MHSNDPKRSVQELLTDRLLPRKPKTLMHKIHTLIDWFGSCKPTFIFRKARTAKIPEHHLQEHYMNYDNL